MCKDGQQLQCVPRTSNPRAGGWLAGPRLPPENSSCVPAQHHLDPSSDAAAIKVIAPGGGIMSALWRCIEGDWKEFAAAWTRGYDENTLRIAQGGEGPSSVDVMFREILEEILTTEKWKALSDKLTNQARDELNLVWHRLDGWPDSTPGLYNLKKEVIIATLSNGNVRLLVDMAKHADLPWDTIFSAELFGSFKPNPKVFLGAVKHLSLEPQNCALVAAHADDLRAAAGVGMRTVYVPRPGEDVGVGEVKSKAEGGNVDVVVQSFEELAKLLTGN
ncbi:HAD-like domain-containing protein [Favolaschia claudopus]|uniref:HAD-like domain-containing protein n=1 Tax=Favolaschia claudopus TaxID=2862362 RepID=A0AAW0BPB7_9AGAR